ncbi:MAG: DUF2782 domain-containing protein [Gammaproteobacteria bacterium]
MSRTILAALLLTASAAYAAEPAQAPRLEDLPDAPPPPPAPLQSEQPIEPEVTIIQKEDQTVQEYRVNGRLYMVKVTPVAGPPYYLLDNDGDGRMEARLNDLAPDFIVPKWVLFSW